jgi:quercetin dioxygenase-like cupin family protein
MKRISQMISVVAAFAFTLSQAEAQKVETVHSDKLLQTDHAWNGVAYQKYPSGRPQLTMLKITIPPNTVLPWHTHPFPSAGYILSGDLTVQDKESAHVFHAGDACAEAVNDVHRGVAGKTGVTILVFYAGTPGVPTSVPINGEKMRY